MDDYKMEVHRGSKIVSKGTRSEDLEKVLNMGRLLFATDRKVTKVIFIMLKKNFKIMLKKNLLRTKY